MFAIKEEGHIISIYILFGTLWILLSDKILYLLVEDVSLLNRLQNIKGFAYVLVSALIFYILIRKDIQKLRKRDKLIKEKYDEIESYNEVLKSLNEEVKYLYKNEHKLNNDLERMVDLLSNITQKRIKDNHQYLLYLFNNIIHLIPKVDYAFLFKLEEEDFKLIDSTGFNSKEPLEINIKKEELILPNKKIIRSDQLEDIIKKKIDTQGSNDLIKSTNDKLILRISFNDNNIGIINLATTHGINFDQRDEKILTSLLDLSTAFFNINEYNKLEIDLQNEIISSFIKMLETYDYYTGGHSQEVAHLSKKIAQRLNLSKETVDQTYWAALLHDIGKVAISRKILNKKGKLTDEEYEEIKEHPKLSSMMLAQSENLKNIAKYVLHHHERWDGKGYPGGLKGDSTPLISQIISVADSWNAMTTNRTYRNKLPKEIALKELRTNKGEQFSPKIVDIFINIIEEDIVKV